MKVLLAVDDSKFSRAAVNALLALALPVKTVVQVLHVSEPIRVQEGVAMTGYSGVNLKKIRKSNWENAVALVDRIAKQLRSKGLQVTTSVVQGKPRSKIIDIASKWKADLIVLGSHGRRGFNRMLLGSVSEAVVHHAPCSVHIVRIGSAR